MSQMTDEFMDKTVEAIAENATPEQMAAIEATEKQHPGAIGALRRIANTVSGGFMAFMSGNGMQMYTKLTKEVALDEAERRFAEILQRSFWGLVEKHLGGIDIRAIQFLIKNPYGRAATMAIIAVPLSGLLASRVEYFSEQDNTRHAKICLFLSRVVAKMALIDGMNAFSIDKLVDKAVGAIIGVAKAEGANIEEAIAQVSDKQVQEASNNGKNRKHMHR